MLLVLLQLRMMKLVMLLMRLLLLSPVQLQARLQLRSKLQLHALPLMRLQRLQRQERARRRNRHQKRLVEAPPQTTTQGSSFLSKHLFYGEQLIPRAQHNKNQARNKKTLPRWEPMQIRTRHGSKVVATLGSVSSGRVHVHLRDQCPIAAQHCGAPQAATAAVQIQRFDDK